MEPIEYARGRRYLILQTRQLGPGRPDLRAGIMRRSSVASSPLLFIGRSASVSKSHVCTDY